MCLRIYGFEGEAGGQGGGRHAHLRIKLLPECVSSVKSESGVAFSLSRVSLAQWTPYRSSEGPVIRGPL